MEAFSVCVMCKRTRVFVTLVFCIYRLRDKIDRLQKDRQVSERETGDGFTLTAELRWKLNQLEKEKLQFTSKYNEEVRCHVKPEQNMQCIDVM